MKIRNNAKQIAWVICLFSLVIPFIPSYADTVPIPPRRPDVMNVSPSYIEQLMERSNSGSDVIEADELNTIPPSSANDEDFVFDDEDDLGILEDIDTESLLSAISPDVVEELVPIPLRKPITEASRTSKNASREKALISFVLKPDQIDLDPTLKQFLMNHAVGMFRNDPGLKMEIQAYATPEDDQAFSDVRRSLARALEVRSFLLSQNIEPTRLKLTPMGQDENNKSDNRIDLLFVASK